MLRLASALLSLVAFWLLLSGMFTPFLVAAGIGSALGVALLCRRLGIVDREGHPIQLARCALFSYWPWLAKEIFRSGWDVSRRILDPRLPISPALKEFRPLQKTGLGLVIHANSITLTPGTITVQAEPGRFLVHGLTREAVEGLAGSDMDRRCARLEEC
ncbi:MAG TPA: Na+/H+ antiporter subunit E [Thiobacillaceae bacterium]|nr:Na+/H+ antiporter subunit E [Thiobacillaceae bacterium]HNU63908.1 Na+/H+ antiporter subunit E [Thiobacillaceae bacterium]